MQHDDKIKAPYNENNFYIKFDFFFFFIKLNIVSIVSTIEKKRDQTILQTRKINPAGLEKRFRT